jgi:hypothetical protein
MKPPAQLARLLPVLLPAVLLAAGCTGTPSAADLVAEQAAAGARVSQAEAAGALLDYVATVNQALRSGDTEELAAMTGPGCPCRDLVATIDARFAGDGELVGAAFDVGAITVPQRQGSRARVRARVSVSEYTVRNRDGLRVGTRPAQDFVATYTVQRDGDTWRVVDVQQAS